MTPEEIEAKRIADEKALLSKIKTQNSEQIGAFKTEFQGLMNDAKSGAITEEDFNAKMGVLEGKLKEFDAEAFKAFKSTLEKMEAKLKSQGTEMKKLQDGGVVEGAKSAFEKQIKDALESESFKEFVDGGGKKKVSFGLKAVSIGANYTGAGQVHITTRDSRVVDHPQVSRLNIRDLLTVMPADLPFLSFIEVYDWDRQVTMVSENGSLTESSFKMREANVDAKRLGTHIPLSKRMLRSVSFVLSHLMQRLPALVRYTEDFQLLWGDGAGNNVTGIFKVADDFAALINTALTGAAGSIASVATYDGGTKTIVTFTTNQLVNNGDTITIALATGGQTGYNAAHTAIVISPKEILIEEAYVAGATALWTFVVNSPFKDSIATAQQIDVLKVAKTLVTQQEYTASGIVLNPVDATKIECLKGNDEHYIDVKRLDSGILTIAGIPVVETTAMPAGKFAVGDWVMAAAIGQFTEMTLEFSESTQEKLTNTVEAIIQEEILFPIYNKYMFVVGDFTTGIAAVSV